MRLRSHWFPIAALGLGIAADGSAWTAAAQKASPSSASPSSSAEGRFLSDLRRSVLEYSAHLPNFICTQVTHRSSGHKGSSTWRDLDESSQIVSFYNGREHYQLLNTRKLSSDRGSFQPWMNSTGEFGSLLRQIFRFESSTQFSRVGTDRIRGRNVETLSYEVDFKHSKYEIRWRESDIPKGVVDAYHGLLYVDPERLAIRRLTLDAQPLPVPFPIRRVSLTLDYDDASVAGQVYNLPLSFTMVVEMQKGEQIRNDVSFRDFRRFLANSRVIPDNAK